MPDKCRNSNGFRAMSYKMCPDLSGGVRVCGLTVNQPPHGFEGSSPSFPTNKIRHFSHYQATGRFDRYAVSALCQQPAGAPSASPLSNTGRPEITHR
jgi:hypothetical protein